MTLTMGDAPLASTPSLPSNFTVEAPRHRLLMTPFPRRVRATWAGRVVLDTRRGQLVHESNLLPVLYVPDDDLDHDALVDTDTTTHCPFKGDASYRSLVIGDRRVPDAVWAYRDPIDPASWLAGKAALSWDAADAWFDEDERVEGHLRDPYHRVDVRRSSRHVRVLVDGVAVADSHRPMVLSETGLENRWYLPPDDVRLALTRSSTTTTVCPYKGEASYFDVEVDATVVSDALFCYQRPLDDASRVAGHLCAVPGERVVVEVDDEATGGTAS